MLIGIGKLPFAMILDNFKLMAQNNNEKHEYYGISNHVHKDGWGIVVRRSGKFECYKKEVACWKDPKFSEFYNLESDIIMLHARKASPGIPISYAFTHPFEQNGWYFCHNGTIYDYKIEEKSDAQQLFDQILYNMKRFPRPEEAIRTTVNSLKDYSALNFILLRDDAAYVLCMYGKRGQNKREYYTMKYLQEKEYIIVSSETLQGFKGEWKKMENCTLLAIDIPNRSLKFFRIK
jgi:glutamine amidotransferase